MMTIADYDAALKTVCPIVGVKTVNVPIQTSDDVFVVYDASATDVQINAAKQLASTFDWSAPNKIEQAKATLKAAFSKATPEMQAIITLLGCDQ